MILIADSSGEHRSGRVASCSIWLVGLIGLAGVMACADEVAPSDRNDTTRLSVRSGEEITLTAPGLFSGVASLTTYLWEQLGGPSVPISDPRVMSIRFTAPEVSEATFIVISLTARQEEAAAAVLYTITVLPRSSTSGGTTNPVDAGSSSAPAVDAGSTVAMDAGTVAVPTPTHTLAFTAMADTFVDQGAASANYGTGRRMEVDLSPDKRAYVMFDVQGLSGTVSRATLRLLVANASSNGPSVLATGTSWTETGLTWSNQAALTGSALGQAAASSVGAWAEVDVTASVRGNGRVAWVLTPNSTDGADFTSREGGGAAQLVVTFGGSSTGGMTDAGVSTVIDAGSSMLVDAGSSALMDAGSSMLVDAGNTQSDAGTGCTNSELRAFPGAEGFGASTPGGRGGRIIAVTNLNDSGPGSLRAALAASGPRIVVFRVAGTIQVDSLIDITNPYITVAGQTAPGDGITLRNGPTNPRGAIRVMTHDVVLRYLRIRTGGTPVDSGEIDTITVGGGSQNIVVDHCSLSWGTDEIFQTGRAQDVTIQWSILSEGLHLSTHPDGGHSKGMHIREESANISVHHNLLAHNHDRNPNINNDGLVDMVNNVIYNARRAAGWVEVKDKFGEPRVNLINNYFRRGPDHRSDAYEVSYLDEGHGLNPQIFVRGNIGFHRATNELSEALIVREDSRFMIVANRFPAPPVTTFSALDAFNVVLEHVGATFPVRDAHDRRVTNDARNGTGRIIDDPSQVGGWLVMAPGTAPADTDGDGMPDAWEREHGLDPNNALDGSRDRNGDGYTNVEDYLNSLVATDVICASGS